MKNNYSILDSPKFDTLNNSHAVLNQPNQSSIYTIFYRWKILGVNGQLNKWENIDITLTYLYS